MELFASKFQEFIPLIKIMKRVIFRCIKKVYSCSGRICLYTSSIALEKYIQKNIFFSKRMISHLKDL